MNRGPGLCAVPAHTVLEPKWNCGHFGDDIFKWILLNWYEWKSTWWRHQMETFSALLTLCVGNSQVTGEFLAQRPVMRSFDVFFGLRLNKRLSKQSWGWWFKTPSRSLWRHCNEATTYYLWRHIYGSSGQNETWNIPLTLGVPGCFKKHKNMLAFFVILWHLDGPAYWNHHAWKTEILLFYIVITVATVGLATQLAVVSIAIMLA